MRCGVVAGGLDARRRDLRRSFCSEKQRIEEERDRGSRCPASRCTGGVLRGCRALSAAESLLRSLGTIAPKGKRTRSAAVRSVLRTEGVRYRYPDTKSLASQQAVNRGRSCPFRAATRGAVPGDERQRQRRQGPQPNDTLPEQHPARHHDRWGTQSPRPSPTANQNELAQTHEHRQRRGSPWGGELLAGIALGPAVNLTILR